MSLAYRWAIALLLLLNGSAVWAADPSIAMFYGNNPPWDELHAFDVVVVEPHHVPEPRLHANSRTALFAYVSVGEVSPDRAYLKKIPPAWRLGENADWGSVVIDQAKPGWPAFFVDRVIKPLWDAGYRGFFLDTLDSYQLYAKSEISRASQETGLVAVIHELKKRYPQARLLFNRGFEILPQVHQDVFAVAAESLFQGWDPARQQYRAVPAADRDWLLGQLTRIKQEFGLPVLSIDYVPPEQRELARATAEKIRRLGFIPWVTNPGLDMLGIGSVEVMPRKVLMLQNVAGGEYDLIETSGFRYGAMPLNYLGYSIEYVDARKPLPEFQLAGRYAGIVVWLDRVPGRESAALGAWLKKQVESHVPVVVLGEASFLLRREIAETLGLHYARSTKAIERLSITQRDELVGFEVQPIFDQSAFFSLEVTGAQPLLTVVNEKGDKQEAVALTEWGGYALNPHVLVELPSVVSSEERKEQGKNMRWVINPIEFLQRALKLPDMPVPDTTTENGRRMLMVHMDGDGFASKSEFPGTPDASQVLIDKILKRFKLPSTISIIQGEIAPDGQHPAKSKVLEERARTIFALPHVEIASHSYSHPFMWRKALHNPDEEGYHLKLPGYSFDLQKEIAGSIEYIDKRLAPPGKQVEVFLWTGDCNVGSTALEQVQRKGVLSMNGGETTITRSFPTLTLVAPLGIPKGDYFQVFAPNQNENVYTNNWLGPFYGYERSIETFELTGAPYRLKPIDIYYHAYSASKPASLLALTKVYNWALKQESTPVFVSDYVRKVEDFNHMVIARAEHGWLVRGNGALRQLRVPSALGAPVMEVDGAVAGFRDVGDIRYVHLAADEARIHFSHGEVRQPYLVSANATVTQLKSMNDDEGTSMSFGLRGRVPLRFALALNRHCVVQAGGTKLKADSVAQGISLFSMAQHEVEELRIHCPR